MNSYDYHRQAKIDKAIDKTAGIYPGGNGEDYLHSGLPGVGYIASRWARIVSAMFVCTRAEFEARKAERQNKPSWSECPDWAHYVAQDSNGDWHWFSHKPLVTTANGWNSILGKFGFSQSGRVIGDWRNTLEQRPNHIGESDEKGDVDAAIESMRDIRTAFANQAVSQFKTSTRYVEQHPCGLSKVEVTIEPDIDFEWLANQFDDADDINAVWALRDKLHHKNKPEPSPELSFHLSNAFKELQASARLLPEDDPRRASIVSLASGVGAVKEVV